ncbi:hypothetical protein BSKO_05676 [Bryopsis sp. KO-2023]|nr:hypothetical protein BSKO_05676 [Bryopsis sp. KO-2023]
MLSSSSRAPVLALVVLVLSFWQGSVGFAQGLDPATSSLPRHPFAAEQNFPSFREELQEGLNSGRTLQAKGASATIGLKVCTTTVVTPVTMPLDPESLAAIPAIPTPKSCSKFSTSDLLGGCQTDINIDEGCCTQTCGAVLGEMEEDCWSDFVANLCDSAAMRVVPFMEKLTERCHMTPQPIDCKAIPSLSKKTSTSAKKSTNGKAKKPTGKAKKNTGKGKKKKATKAVVIEEPAVPAVKKCSTKKECKVVTENLFTAAEGGDVNLVKEQVLRGADIEAKDDYGWTPLILAAWKGRVDVLQYLIDEGAEVDAKNDDGSTALIEASYWGHASAVEVLLAEGAKVNGKGQLGATALLWAALNGKAMVADVLISEGAEVNARDKTGATALHWAAGIGREDVVKSLVNAGANKKAVDRKGKSVMDVACEHGFCTVDIKFNIFKLLGKQ